MHFWSFICVLHGIYAAFPLIWPIETLQILIQYKHSPLTG
jgi:hypothetical protein